MVVFVPENSKMIGSRIIQDAIYLISMLFVLVIRCLWVGSYLVYLWHRCYLGCFSLLYSCWTWEVFPLMAPIWLRHFLLKAQLYQPSGGFLLYSISSFMRMSSNSWFFVTQWGFNIYLFIAHQSFMCELLHGWRQRLLRIDGNLLQVVSINDIWWIPSCSDVTILFDGG